MPIATFNGVTREVTLLQSGDIDLRVLYSDSVRWIHDNPKFEPFFEATGGELVDAATGIYSMVYVRLTPSTSGIRPREANQKLRMTNGVLLTADGTGSAFLPTYGSYMVEIEHVKPVEAIAFASSGGSSGGSGLTSQQVANAVFGQQLPGNITFEQLLRYVAAVLLGNTQGVGTSIEVFKDLSGQVAVTSHNDGNNRTGVDLAS